METKQNYIDELNTWQTWQQFNFCKLKAVYFKKILLHLKTLS